MFCNDITTTLFPVAFLEAKESYKRKSRSEGLMNVYPIVQYQYANYSSPLYKVHGKGFLKLRLIKQRSDFSFALFSGGLSNVCHH